MGKLYVDFLQLGSASTDAVKLKAYRAPKTNAGDAGDFAAVLYSVIKDRAYNNTNMRYGESVCLGLRLKVFVSRAPNALRLQTLC